MQSIDWSNWYLVNDVSFFFLLMEVFLRVCMLCLLRKVAHNHDTWITADEAQWNNGIRTQYNSVVQHILVQGAVAIFGPPRAVAALAHELSARLLAQGNNRRGGSNDISKQVKLKNVCIPPRNAVEKRTRAYHLKWLHWHNFFTVERSQVSALLNGDVSLSFPWVAKRIF